MKKVTITKTSDEDIDDDAEYVIELGELGNIELKGDELKEVLKKLPSFSHIEMIDNPPENP